MRCRNRIYNQKGPIVLRISHVEYQGFRFDVQGGDSCVVGDEGLFSAMFFLAGVLVFRSSQDFLIFLVPCSQSI